MLRLDRRDLVILRLLPPRVKRFLVRAAFGIATPFLPRTVEVGGSVLIVPRKLRRKYLLFEHEAAAVKAVEQCVSSGAVTVDVGANFGFFTALLSDLVGPQGQVIAVEPAAENLELLRHNVATNKLVNVRVVPAAAGAERGQAVLFLHRSSSRHSFHLEAGARRRARVEVVRVDEVVPESVDFAKIDVEGAEIEVLEGMSRHLEQESPVTLLVEWNPSLLEAAGREPLDLPEWLLRNGFEVTPLTDAEADPVSWRDQLDAWQRGDVPRQWYTSLLAKRGAVGRA